VSPLSANRFVIPNIGMSMNIRIAWRRNLFMIYSLDEYQIINK